LHIPFHLQPALRLFGSTLAYAISFLSLRSILEQLAFTANPVQSIMTNKQDLTHFAPELHIPNGTTEIAFYKKLGASENICLRNEDGSIHVAELDINGAIFHLHEIVGDALEPISAKGVTSVTGLFVPDVEEVMQKALQAGATLIHPTTDHDYGYRQGMFKDPFGHYWQIQKKI
jgi:PhnB protein